MPEDDVRHTAAQDPSLAAVVTRAAPLHYDAGPDARLDRPAFVRAASALLRSTAGLAVVQDDANFIALLDPSAGGHALALALPAGAGGLRQFDDLRGNKRDKLDLEAGVVAPDGAGGEVLIAFGSGSSPLRERVALVEGLSSGAPAVSLVPAPQLYAALRGLPAFAGSELNVEGALYVAGCLLLLNRGNGAPRDGLLPLNAACALDWPQLYASLRDRAIPPPGPRFIAQYELGAIGGLPLSFTDAAAAWGALLYSAAAEDSPDALRDGPVAGSAVGVIRGAHVRWAPLTTPDGALFAGKVEGLLPDPSDPARLLVVVDRDDPRAPSELCEVAIVGPWFP